MLIVLACQHTDGKETAATIQTLMPKALLWQWWKSFSPLTATVNSTLAESLSSLSSQGFFVCLLLNISATCKCLSETDLLRQFYVLPHWDRSCRSNSPSHPLTVYWHPANQSQHWPYNTRRLAGKPLECHIFKSLVWLDPRKILSQAGFEPGIFRSRGGRLNHTRLTRWCHFKACRWLSLTFSSNWTVIWWNVSQKQLAHMTSECDLLDICQGGRNSLLVCWARCSAWYSVVGLILPWGEFFW